MKIVKRKDVPEDYKEMLKTESHHQHLIIMDKNGVLRWKEDPFVSKLIRSTNLNLVIEGLYENGFDKNSEIYRALYRKIGYSLSGYWEIFYWDVNNEDADEYQQPIN